MDCITKYNLKLYNLIECGHSEKTISRIMSRIGGKKIGSEDVYNVIGNTLTADSIVNDLSKMTEDYFSIYCLLYFDINIFVVNKIREKYDSIEMLATEVEELPSKLKLHQNTISKILYAINELSDAFKIDTKTEILNIIKENESINNNTLKEFLLNKYQNLSVREYDEYVDQLINENKITYGSDGFKIKKKNISEYLVYSNDPKDLIVRKKCSGETFEKIAKDIGVTKQRIQQILKKQISHYPIFENELKYKNLLCTYKFDSIELNLMKIDLVLAEYVYLKYNLKPTKTSLDYINDFNLFNSLLGVHVLKNKNLTIIHNELIELDFITIFKKFVSDSKISSFTVDEIVNEFNDYLRKFGINDKSVFIELSDDLECKIRKISNSKSFIRVYGNHFIVNNQDELSFDFVNMMRNYLDDFEGYGSVELFYDKNTELCNKNNIFSSNELFALMKEIFSKEFENKIKFDRNPVIVSKGIDKSRFIENLILDMDLPCTVNDYLQYVHMVTGLKETSVLANFGGIINQFKNANGLISLEDDISKTDKDLLYQLLDCDCIGYNYLKEKLDIKFNSNNEKIEVLLNANNLRKMGYIKTNTSVYSEKYSSRLESVFEQLKNMDYSITEMSLSKISNIEYFYYKTYDCIDKCYLIKINKNTYLNLIKRNQCELVRKLKDDILLSLDDNMIYSLDNYMESIEFKKVLNTNVEYKDLLYSFNSKVMIEYLIMTNRNISYVNSLGTIIFSKMELSIRKILDKIMFEYESLTILELKEILYEKYKIKKDISNSELSDMGYYCPKSSEKVYLNKNYYEKEMEKLLHD